MDVGGVDTEEAAWLLCRAASCFCALPVDPVIEIMRPLPIEPVSGMPAFLRGLCVIRGSPVPVIDAGLLLIGRDIRATRFVTIIIGARTVALAVEQVIGIRRIDLGSLSGLPPLLQSISGNTVEAIRALDGELLLLLDAARIVPQSLLDQSLLDQLNAAGSSP